MSAREAMLKRIQQSVIEGNRAGVVPKLPERVNVGYQGAGVDPVERFCAELASAGGKSHHAADGVAALRIIQAIVQAHHARRLLLSRGGLVDRLELRAKLRAMAFDAGTLDDLPTNPRDDFFAAEIGITNVHRLIAETGSVVVASRPNEPRSLSLLPPVHICLAERSQLLPDLFDLFDLYSPLTHTPPPSCLTLITGPSKTGDIELKLVTGVHGPGEVHVIFVGS
jgi:L-lactate utilization protein LutC